MIYLDMATVEARQMTNAPANTGTAYIVKGGERHYIATGEL